MIWVSHDLFSNLTGSVASGDTELTLSIFKSELSDLIVYNTDKLFELFDKVEVKYKKSDSDEVIVGKVLDEMNTNAKFIRGLSFLIAESNDVIKNNKDKKWKTLLDKITSAVKKINTNLADPKDRQLFQKQTLEMIEIKASKVGNRDRKIKKKDYTVLWIFGIAIVGVSAYLLFEYLRKKRIEKALAMNVAKMELGGQTAPTDLPPPNSAQVAPVNPATQPLPAVATAPVVPKYDPTDPAFNVSESVLVPAPQPQTVVNIGTQQPQAINQTPVNQVLQQQIK